MGAHRTATATCAALAAFATSLACLPALAQAPSPRAATDAARPRIVLSVEGAADGVAARIEAELRAMGFEVVLRGSEAGAPPPPDPSALRDVARAAEAAAAIRVARSADATDVWIADRVTGKTVQRSVPSDEPATTAIRVVELLRASLLEVRARHPSRGEVAPDAVVEAAARDEAPVPAAAPPSPTPSPRATAPPPPVRPAAPRPSKRGPPPSRGAKTGFAIGAGPAVLWSAGGVPASGTLEIEGHVMPWAHVGFESFAMLPLSSASFEGTEGTVDAWPALVALGARIAPSAADARWRPSFGAGVAAAWMHVSGEPSSDAYVGSSVDAFAAVPHVRAGLSVGVVGPLRVASHGFVGLSAPRVVVDAAGRERATWGHPMLGLSLGAELASP